MYLSRHLHGARQPRGQRGDQRPVRPLAGRWPPSGTPTDSARRSTRGRCSEPPTRSSRTSAGSIPTRAGHGLRDVERHEHNDDRSVRDDRRARDPRRAGDGTRRCSAAARWRSAVSPTRAPAPSVSGLPGLSAGRQREGGRVHDEDRPGAQLQDRRALAVPPEELLLSGHAEELSDHAVRPAARVEWLRRDRRATSGRRTVGITRVHLEEDTGKSLHVGGIGPHRRLASTRSRTSTGPEPRSSRSSPSPISIRPRRRACSSPSSGPARDPGRIGRAHGRGLDASRRQRLGAAEGRDGATEPKSRSRT